jgi:hypothetical protein
MDFFSILLPGASLTFLLKAEKTYKRDRQISARRFELTKGSKTDKPCVHTPEKTYIEFIVLEIGINQLSPNRTSVRTCQRASALDHN